MLFSEISDRPVMDTATAQSIGQVDSLVIASGPARVIALRLKKTNGGDSLLVWPAVHAIGPDAVMARSSTHESAEEHVRTRAEACSGLIGRRILSKGGRELGTLRDLEFDPESGSVLGLLTSFGTLPGQGLLGVGSYAVVVQEA
ncbi:PRC-barrel domain-containing protein [Streptomyces sp. PR69]|uniref:PRC-barrel domain-containing protein n=1 Tax=Streptomyces sp. PR69 TaxID=2984950 RepID=UPI0022653BD6|nr:PRC-barrel domain-containing protein [Streptomyces sp. PR69]